MSREQQFHKRYSILLETWCSANAGSAYNLEVEYSCSPTRMRKISHVQAFVNAGVTFMTRKHP